MDEGIYYILGDMIPIQIVCLRELSEDENLWLKCLTNRLEKKAAVEAAVEETRMESHRVGLQEGEELFARLSCMLLKSGRQEEILKAAQDREYRQKLFEELGIKTES